LSEKKNFAPFPNRLKVWAIIMAGNMPPDLVVNDVSKEW